MFETVTIFFLKSSTVHVLIKIFSSPKIEGRKISIVGYQSSLLEILSRNKAKTSKMIFKSHPDHLTFKIRIELSNI